MLESIFIILLIIAIILLVVFVEWKSPSIAMIDLILWFILALGIHQIEIPYQYTSGGVVYDATQSIETMFPLSILFYGIGIIVLLYIVVEFLLPYLQGKFTRML